MNILSSVRTQALLLIAIMIALSACGRDAAVSTVSNDPPLSTEVLSCDEGVSSPVSSENVPALWCVSDGDTRIYLYGTLHATKPGRVWFARNAMAAFEASDTVYLEVEQNTPYSVRKRILKNKAYNPDGVTLASYLSEEEQALVQEAALQAGVSWNSLQSMKPWKAAITLGNAKLTRSGVDTATGVEATLIKKAGQGGKSLRGFVSFDTHTEYMGDLPMDVQVHYLMFSITAEGESPDEFEKLYEAWISGDVEALEETALGTIATDIPEFYAVLMKGRNRLWADTLEEVLQKETGTFFVAVGAGHLVGPDSVQNMLAEKGLVFKRL